MQPFTSSSFAAVLSSPLLVRVALALTVLLAAPLRAGDFVVVSAEAIPQYNRPKTSRGTPQPQSYTFSQGRHFNATTRDASENAATFVTVAQSLAPALAKQAYFPAKDPKQADLLIIVHWGTTQTYEDPNRELDIERTNAALSEYKDAAGPDGNADPGRLNELKNEMANSASLQQQYMDRNADLLGYRRSLRERSQRLYASEQEITMRHELNEERYFVILMAYDYAAMRQEKKSRLLWTTHMSVRSAGTNFRIALPQMTVAGASYFGRDFADPVHLETDDREARVEVGEPTVVPPPAPTPDAPAAPRK